MEVGHVSRQSCWEEMNMDWSRSKSIFIIVFLILNLFLYSLYLNRHTEAKKVEVLGEQTIEARLSEDNITYSSLPVNIESAPYLSGEARDFEKVEIQLSNYESILVENGNKMIITLEEPVKIENIDDDASLIEFLNTHVLNGSSYILWEKNEENQSATFFQHVNNRTIYYNIYGVVTVYWNEQGEITMYEQTMLEQIEKLEEEEKLLSPIQIIQALYAKGLLKPDSHIAQMKLGYSTLVQLTQTQVFVPTWEVRVIAADGSEEEYFVNAVEGKVIDVDVTNVEAIEDRE